MNTLHKTIPALVNQVLETFEIPGCAVAVQHHNQTIFMEGFGVLKKGGTDKVTPETMFALASISKSTTAACLAKLVHEGKASWSDRIRKFLPDFEFFDPFTTQEITLKDLLIHNSGLPSVSGGTIWYGSNLNQRQVIDRIKFIKPEASFRAQYAYQNITFVIAGEIIRQLSGLTWEDYFQENFLKPLGMQRTTTTQATLQNMENVAVPHTRIYDQVQKISHRSHDNIGPAASVYACTRDWLKYCQLFLNQGQVNQQKILTPETIHDLWTVHTPRPIEPYPMETGLRPPMFAGYGMGWYIEEYRGQRMVWHTGGVDGMRTLMILIPEEQLSVLVFTNMEASLAYRVIGYTILDQILSLPPVDWLAVYTRECQKIRKEVREKFYRFQPDPVQKLIPDADVYLGTYFHSLCGPAQISVKNTTQLRLKFIEKPAFQGKLTFIRKDRFLIEWDDPYIPNGNIVFIFNHHGQISGLRLEQPNLLDVDFSELDNLIKQG